MCVCGGVPGGSVAEHWVWIQKAVGSGSGLEPE